TLEVLEMFVKHVLFADSLLQRYDRYSLLVGELLDGLDESPRHLRHHQSGSTRFPAMLAEEDAHPAASLEHRLVDVEVHPVDALQFEIDVFADDFRNGRGYTHLPGSDSPWFFPEPPPQRGPNNVQCTIRMDRSPFFH